MPPSNSVYLAGIPFDFTEEQIQDIAKSVGPIKSGRLLFDLSTGKSKGIFIIEYYDMETASSAVRNLHRYSVGLFGGRERLLRCNFVGMGDKGDLRIIDEFSNNDIGFNAVDRERERLLAEIPPLPAGNTISQYDMNSLNGNIYDSLINLDHMGRLKSLLKDAKIMSETRPDVMELLLEKNPQLMYSLLQASALLNHLTPQKMTELLSIPIDDAKISESSGSFLLFGLDEKMAQMIQMVCSLSEDDIKSLVSNSEQKSLYLQIKNKYSGCFV